MVCPNSPKTDLNNARLFYFFCHIDGWFSWWSRSGCRVLITSHGPISISKLYLYRTFIYFYLLFIIISNVECIFAWYASLWLNYVSEFIYC